MLFKFDNNYAKQHKQPLMEAYQCNITVNLSISHRNKKVLLSIVNILCYLNLIIIYDKQHK